jgi:hypothetical protein
MFFKKSIKTFLLNLLNFLILLNAKIPSQRLRIFAGAQDWISCAHPYTPARGVPKAACLRRDMLKRLSAFDVLWRTVKVQEV